MSDPYASLRIPRIRRFIAGRFVAAFGRQMVGVAVGWYIYERTNDPFALGMVGLVQVVPVLLLSLPGGHLVDRLNRRDLAILGQAARLGIALGLYAATSLAAPLPVFYALLACAGATASFEWPATSSLLPQIVPRELFANANAWRSSAFQLANTLGPATGGFLLAWNRDPRAIFLVDAFGSTVFALMLLSIHRESGSPPPRERGPLGREVRAGLSFLFGNELLLAVTSIDLFTVILAGAEALMPVYARDVLHVGPTGLGWLRAAPSVGALVAALVQTRFPPTRRTGRTLFIVVAGYAAALAVFGLSRSYALSLVCLAVSGACDNVSVVIRITLEQIVTPEHLRGRVAAVRTIFVSLSNELGEFESGLAASLFGPVIAVTGGAAAALAIVAVSAWRWPALRRLGSLSDVVAQTPHLK